MAEAAEAVVDDSMVRTSGVVAVAEVEDAMKRVLGEAVEAVAAV